ncbi:glycosyltransferase family 2 protein [Agrilactobacillus fermenti]|uniref:glycosyltransferase family 2 protein n=1 Tax=Agrilactobacillus fermenti TaxID=2586909 RepID=UPI003A5C1593
MSDVKVAAVVVTFNKLDLLKENLAAIRQQTTPVSHIIVIDNHSTDETPDYLKQQTDLINIRTDENLGGAGGFNRGLKAFMSETHDDLAWIMDDDTMPQPDALAKLLNAGQKVTDYGFLCSNVKWTDNMPSLMNIPNVQKTGWNLIAEKGLINVQSCSFVSVLIPRKVIQKIGYPISKFFIWGDDFEYTLRITTTDLKENGYFVGDSIAIHKMKANLPVDILHEANGNRIDRFFYNYRNLYYISKKQGGRFLLRHIVTALYTLVKVPFVSPNRRLKRMGLILHGLFAGMVFKPEIEYPKSN